MKTIFKIFMISLWGSLLLTSCRTDDQLTLKDITPTAIDDIPQKSFILTEPSANTNPLMATITWTQTEFSLSSASHPEPAGTVNYALQMDIDGNNFANPVTVASTNGLSANLFVKDINAVLLNKFNAVPEEEAHLELRILTYYGQNNSIPSSNTLKISVTPYKPLEEVQAVYLLGDMNGWNNTSTEYIMFRNSNNPDDRTYTYTGRIAGNTYFKFIPQESLGTYKAYCRKDDSTMTYEETDAGAFYNEFERYVTITINTQDLTYTIIDYTGNNTSVFYSTIGPIGGFCNWDNEPAMTKSSYDGHQWSGTFTFDVSTACKFRGNHDWVNNWGGSAEEFPYGKAVFDGPGANIAVPGTYKIYFNDLTGHYTILQQ